MASGDPLFSIPLSASPEPELTNISDVNPSDWLEVTKVSNQNDYLTPFPTTLLDAQSWTSFVRPSMPLDTMAPSVIGPLLSQHNIMANALNRPRSSPSTFGMGADTVDWPVSSGLGIHYPPDLPPASTVPGNLFAPGGEDLGAWQTPKIQAPVPRRPYKVIAPNPAGLAQKRAGDDDDLDSDPGSHKRRKRAASISITDLPEEDHYLVQLRESEGLSWKEIATRFSTEKGKSLQVPALQMRYKRLRERHRIWEEQDIQALRLGHEYWAKYKWEIISQKMTEYGSAERWPARSCARKWEELEPVAAASTGMTPLSIQATTGATTGPVQFAFLPIW